MRLVQAISRLTPALCVSTTSFAQQLPPLPQIPEITAPVLPGSYRPIPTITIPKRAAPVPMVIHVSVNGSDNGDGSQSQPFKSLTRTQAAVRLINATNSVTVELADGTYRLTKPLRFTAQDGGHNSYRVTWQAAPGAHPVISGGTPVMDWRLADAARDIWVSNIPRGAEPRQLWVNDRLAERAQVEAPRHAFAFREWGMEIIDPGWLFLAGLPDQTRMEVENTAWFTHRHAVVDHIAGNRIVMKQPGWRNNLIGYDTFARPVSGENARLFFVNSLAFLRTGGQWFADPATGRLYYKPREGEDMRSSTVILPQLPVLVSIAGNYDHPVTDLQFRGLSFQHTSWLGPSGAGGYPSQQSGAFLAGELANYPRDAIQDCSWGCRAFESTRNHWRQQPAAVQVAAASRIVFANDEFTHLGQVALGIGNNADANLSGIGLGATSIEILRSRFSDLAGGAIMVGGITPEAHHPPRPEMGVRDILIRDNTIENVSQNYREQAAVLVTYATAPVIMHNDISAAPYDGIDVGWGWGANDPGGSAAYRTTADRGYYDLPGNLTYDTPTILRDSVVFGNRVHDVKRWFPDGGAIYHLSADPGALIAENYVYDVPGGIGLYLDEGSRYVTVRNNVIANVGVWLNLNTQDAFFPRRTAMNNNAIGNWYNSGRITGAWTEYLDNRLVDNTEVNAGEWPAAARDVIARSGVQPERDRDRSAAEEIPRSASGATRGNAVEEIPRSTYGATWGREGNPEKR